MAAAAGHPTGVWPVRLGKLEDYVLDQEDIDQALASVAHLPRP